MMTWSKSLFCERQRTVVRHAVITLMSVVLVIAGSDAATVGIITRVSVSTGGGEANDHSGSPTISADGRYIAFTSSASNLVTRDPNEWQDVFVHDRVTGETSRVSIPAGGGRADNQSFNPSISGDGRFVAFVSDATNLVPGDINGKRDVFVRDRQAGTTTRVSVHTTGGQGNGDSGGGGPQISGNGRYVVFYSEATNLVPRDTNNVGDIFVYDRQTHETSRVSVATGGIQFTTYSTQSSISWDGRFVAFTTESAIPQISVHDRQTGETIAVSVPNGIGQANKGSFQPSISGDGRFVTFMSEASNFVQGDTNGHYDIFVRDRQMGQTSRVSVSTGGGQANSDS